MNRILLIASVAGSVGLLASTYIRNGYPMPGIVLLALGLAWLVGVLKGWTWSAFVGLIAANAFAAAGVFLGLSAGSLFLAALLALVAWDLADFSFRLRKAAADDDLAGLEQRHFLRLLVVILIGSALSATALRLHFRLSFEWLAVLVIPGVWGISRVVARLFSKGE